MLYHAQKQNLRSPVPGFEARREHVATGRDMCDTIPVSQLGGGGAVSCGIIKKHPGVVPTILSFFSSADERQSLSLFTLQPVYISKSRGHQSLTPSPYEEISDQLALIRAVLVSSIICPTPARCPRHECVRKHICMHKRAQTPNLGQQLLSSHSNVATETSLRINAVPCPFKYSKGTRKRRTIL